VLRQTAIGISILVMIGSSSAIGDSLDQSPIVDTNLAAPVKVDSPVATVDSAVQPPAIPAAQKLDTVIKKLRKDTLKLKSVDTAAFNKKHIAAKETTIVKEAENTFSPVPANTLKTIDTNPIIEAKSQPQTHFPIVTPLRVIYGAILLFFLIVIAFLIVIILRYQRRNNLVTTTHLAIMDREVQRACRYIETNFGDPVLSAAIIAEQLTTGEAFLQALFSRELGMSMEEFIGLVRVNRAKLMLTERTETNPDILALSIGFSSKDEFLKAFKNAANISFEEYLKTTTRSSSKTPNA
jgi:AraC-like DNA-binding protein